MADVDEYHGGPPTEQEDDDLRLKAELWDQLCQMILDEFSDIIRGEWNTSDDHRGGGAIGCIHGALTERAAVLIDPAALAAHWGHEQWRVALEAGEKAGKLQAGLWTREPSIWDTLTPRRVKLGYHVTDPEAAP